MRNGIQRLRLMSNIYIYTWMSQSNTNRPIATEYGEKINAPNKCSTFFILFSEWNGMLRMPRRRIKFMLIRMLTEHEWQPYSTPFSCSFLSSHIIWARIKLLFLCDVMSETYVLVVHGERCGTAAHSLPLHQVCAIKWKTKQQNKNDGKDFQHFSLSDLVSDRFVSFRLIFDTPPPPHNCVRRRFHCSYTHTLRVLKFHRIIISMEWLFWRKRDISVLFLSCRSIPNARFVALFSFFFFSSFRF